MKTIYRALLLSVITTLVVLTVLYNSVDYDVNDSSLTQNDVSSHSFSEDSSVVEVDEKEEILSTAEIEKLEVNKDFLLEPGLIIFATESESRFKQNEFGNVNKYSLSAFDPKGQTELKLTDFYSNGSFENFQLYENRLFFVSPLRKFHVLDLLTKEGEIIDIKSLPSGSSQDFVLSFLVSEGKIFSLIGNFGGEYFTIPKQIHVYDLVKKVNTVILDDLSQSISVDSNSLLFITDYDKKRNILTIKKGWGDAMYAEGEVYELNLTSGKVNLVAETGLVNFWCAEPENTGEKCSEEETIALKKYREIFPVKDEECGSVKITEGSSERSNVQLIIHVDSPRIFENAEYIGCTE